MHMSSALVACSILYLMVISWRHEVPVVPATNTVSQDISKTRIVTDICMHLFLDVSASSGVLT